MPLTGVETLIRRLEDLSPSVRRAIGQRWADETVKAARQRVRGRIGESIHVVEVSPLRARVGGSFKTSFIEKGARAHTEVPRRARAMRFSSGGRTVFAKKVFKPRLAAHPFKEASAREGWDRARAADELRDAWSGR